jgi:hypothetical protein
MSFRILAALCFLPLLAPAQERFKDRLWLWCHVAGAHNDGGRRFYMDHERRVEIPGIFPKSANRYRFKHEFEVSPAEAAAELGIENGLMVKYNMGPNPGPERGRFARYYEHENFGAFKKVIWSLVGEGGATSAPEQEETLSLAAGRTNIVGFVMDDFFVRPNRKRPLSPGQIRGLQRRIKSALPERTHRRLWVVLYDSDLNDPHFGTRFAPWLREVDGITLWFKGERPLRRKNMEEKLARLERKISNWPRRPEIILGCYMWRYLERKHGEISAERMATQLDFARDHLADGRLAGVIFLGSPIVDASRGAPARNNILAVKKWIAQNGERVVTSANN